MAEKHELQKMLEAANLSPTSHSDSEFDAWHCLAIQLPNIGIRTLNQLYEVAAYSKDIQKVKDVCYWVSTAYMSKQTKSVVIYWPNIPFVP